jgi:TM2 domain-containing membrane protein YozV
MNHYPTTRKSPALSGLLSFFLPGTGQLYNEEFGKGIILLVAFFGSIFLGFAGHMIPWHQFPFTFGPSMYWGPRFPQNFFSTIYPLLWVFILFPVLWLYGFFDAIFSANRINRHLDAVQPRQPYYPPPTYASHQSPPPQPASSSQFSSTTQASVAQNTQTPSSQEANTMNQQSTNTHYQTHQQSPPPNPPAREKGGSGKSTLGIILLIVGGLLLAQQMDLHYLSWHLLWPLIPLVFGLRLLRDYSKDRDTGQFLLGSIFTGVGVIFLLENWDIINILSWISDYWGILIIGIALLLFWQDYNERKNKAGSRKNGNQ